MAENLKLILNSPLFSTFTDKWNFIMDSKVIVQMMCDNNNLSLWDNNRYGEEVILRGLTLRTKLGTYYAELLGQNFKKNQAYKLERELGAKQKGKKTKKEKNALQYKIKSLKIEHSYGVRLTEILRFIRNSGLHAGENMDKPIFQKYFPDTYRQKESFITKIIEKIPNLLAFLWALEHSELGLHDPYNLSFVQCLKKTLDSYAEGDNLISRMIWRQTYELTVMRLERSVYERLYGVIIRVKNTEIQVEGFGEDKSFKIENDNSTLFDIHFGTHTLDETLKCNTYLFLDHSNQQDIVSRMGEPAQIEAGVIFINHIKKAGKFRSDGKDFSVQHFPDEDFKTLNKKQLLLLIDNQPVELFIAQGQ